MDNHLIALLGGLIGSILTVIITKALDLVQKRNEFKYDLKRVFFNKKLQVAEAAISQYSLLSETLNQLIILYSRYNETNSEFGAALNDTFLKQANEKLVLVNSSFHSSANSISLYFDLPSEYTSNEILSAFFDNLNALSPYAEAVEFTFNQYQFYKGTEKEEEAYEIYSQSEIDLGNSMAKLSSTYKEFDEELRRHIQKIRNEMKKYE